MRIVGEKFMYMQSVTSSLENKFAHQQGAFVSHNPVAAAKKIDADRVDISADYVANMSEEEVQQLLTFTQNQIFQNPIQALSVHSGLNLERAQALLAEDDGLQMDEDEKEIYNNGFTQEEALSAHSNLNMDRAMQLLAGLDDEDD